MLSTSRTAARQALRASGGRLLTAASGSSGRQATASQIASSSRSSLVSPCSFHTSFPVQQETRSPVSQESMPQVNFRLTPKAAESVDSVQEWLRAAFPSLPFPDDVAMQMITHESYDHGAEAGHNRRLAFLGRRAMKFYLNLFLAQHQAANDGASGVHTSDRVDALLQTSMLGDQVGRVLKLGEVMRWTPAIGDGQVGAKETGLFKIRGVTVEALLGAIYHQHGAQTARSFFASHVLPNLSTFTDQERDVFGSAIQEEARKAEAHLRSSPFSSASGVNVSSSPKGAPSDTIERETPTELGGQGGSTVTVGRTQTRTPRRRSEAPVAGSAGVPLEDDGRFEGRGSVNAGL